MHAIAGPFISSQLCPFFEPAQTTRLCILSLVFLFTTGEAEKDFVHLFDLDRIINFGGGGHANVKKNSAGSTPVIETVLVEPEHNIEQSGA
jgi:hypothetical protein